MLNKSFILYIITLAIFLTGCDTKKQTITISGAFALYPLAVRWGQEFEKSHPEVKVDISGGGTGKGIADVLSGNVNIGMVSRDLNEEEVKRGAFEIAVAKDAVVPTVNAKNVYLKHIKTKGISQKIFKDIWITGKAETWGNVLGNNSTTPIKVYTRSDASGAPETWAKYLGKKQEDLLGIGVFGDPGLAQIVKGDVNGIGFNNIIFVYDLTSKKNYEGIEVVPIDINEDGKIDASENFYENLDELVEAISNGTYPSPPARNLYFVIKGKPSDKLVTEFLNWVLTKGQTMVGEAGYVELPDEKLIESKGRIK